MLLEKPIEQLSEDDLMALVAPGAESALSLEMRRNLPRQTNSGKLELLNDVVSFANAIGGHILYGVEPADMLAAELAGLENNEVAAAVEWIEQSAWKGISPRIPGLRVKVVPLRNQKSILAVRIPKTITNPHMVTFQEANKFYSRNTMGKYALGVEELRAAFSAGEALRDKMRAFRTERLTALRNRALSIQLSDVPKMVLHIMPATSFQAGFRIDLDQVAAGDPQSLWPMAGRGMVSQFNYDGLITFSSTEKYAYSHLQVFRSGCLEAAESSLLNPKDGRKLLSSVAFEREVIQCGERMLALFRRLEIHPPFVVMLSFLGIREYSMFVGSIRWQPSAHPIERDNLFLDEVIVDDPMQNFAKAMRPAFDQMWNSCGWPRSLNYDPAGNWSDQLA